VQVVQPVLFINRMVGTQGVFTTEAIEEYLNLVIVSRFNDFMGERIDSLLNLPAKYDELSKGLADRLQEDFMQFGLGMTQLYINSITPPAEVQQAIDDKSRMNVFTDMNKLMQMKAAMAMEKAAEGDASSQGMGAALGLMMPAMLAQYFTGQRPSGEAPTGESAFKCHECGHAIPGDAKFCPACGHQLLVFQKCVACGKNLTPNARFCSRCGHAVEEEPPHRKCPGCGAEGLAGATFCNQCGEKF
jgi:membrane protease subunit (stomatin/prohibitin family)